MRFTLHLWCSSVTPQTKCAGRVDSSGCLLWGRSPIRHACANPSTEAGTNRLGVPIRLSFLGAGDFCRTTLTRPEGCHGRTGARPSKKAACCCSPVVAFPKCAITWHFGKAESMSKRPSVLSPTTATPPLLHNHSRPCQAGAGLAQLQALADPKLLTAGQWKANGRHLPSIRWRRGFLCAGVPSLRQ